METSLKVYSLVIRTLKKNYGLSIRTKKKSIRKIKYDEKNHQRKYLIQNPTTVNKDQGNLSYIKKLWKNKPVKY